MFAQKKVTLTGGKHKIIILDEADSMTPAAQQALRRIMEIYSSTTRFALACNLSTKVCIFLITIAIVLTKNLFYQKIIEPIQSRCAIVRFSRLSDEQILKRVMEIIKIEKVSIIQPLYHYIFLIVKLIIYL